MEQYEKDGKINKNYKNKVIDEVVEAVDLPQGTFVTNCNNCNFTCHYDCRIQQDDKKFHCVAMNNQSKYSNRLFRMDTEIGNSSFLGDPAKASCKECKRHCFWKDHVNMPYQYKIKRIEVEKTYEDVKKKYEEALGKQATKREVINKIQQESDAISDKIQRNVNEIRENIAHLDSIALKTAATDSASYIQHMIDTEDMNRVRCNKS